MSDEQRKVREELTELLFHREGDMLRCSVREKY